MTRRPLAPTVLLAAGLSACLSGCHACPGTEPDARPVADNSNTADAVPTPPPATPLLDEDLTHWAPCNFGADGEASFTDGTLHLSEGDPLTGVRYTGDLAELLGDGLDNYEITLEAARLDGYDFFVGLTVPVGTEGHVTLILGGWAGTVVGLSSLDGYDASENATTQVMPFENGQWYAVRLRVTPDRIQAWLDDEPIIDVARADYETFDVRAEVAASRPLGLCTFRTHAGIRALAAQRLTPQANLTGTD